MANDDKWRFDKHVSVGHILTTLSLFAASIGVYINMDDRIDSNTQAIAHEKELRQIESKHVRETMENIDKKVDKNGLKLDRLLERVNGHNNGKH